MNSNYDQRGNLRYIYQAAVWHENIIPGRFYMAKIGNISRGGAFITTKDKFTLGQMILLDIREDKTCEALQLKG